MKLLPYLFLALSLLARSVTAAEAPLLTAEELAEGWICLFDGETLFGWNAESKADWEVKEGAIVVSQGEPGLLRTTAQFDNYVLKVDFRAAKGANSGVFLRTAKVVGMMDVTKACYELNIAPPENPFPTGSLVGRAKCEGAGEKEGWRTFEVTCSGPKIEVKLDGEQVLSYVDPKPLGRGFIGLQLNSGKCEFKNVKLKPLGMKPLLNGKNLDGWRTHVDSKSKFTVTKEGWLNVKDGRGQLETTESYGDFVLQLECISHAKQLNSGVFFRCIPKDFMNGYESQIHNGFKDGDRTQPVDCGTGGIFRQQNARKVVPNDDEWFSKTIIADGPHVAVWVNGYQVTDWTDTRKPDANPRKGVRVEPGTLMIQGHDPTTNLSFRGLRIAEMAKR